MKFLIFGCLLAAVAAQEELSEAEQRACVDVYLKGGDLSSGCENVIKSMKEPATEFLTDDVTIDWITNCIKENMKTYSLFEFFLRTELEEDPEQSKIGKSLQIDVRNTLQNFCRRLYQFDDTFDKFLEESRLKREDIKYQCLYKYAIEKKIIEKTVFGFDTSAFNSFNCTGYFAQFDEDFKKTVPPNDDALSKFEKCVFHKGSQYRLLRDGEIIKAIGTFELSGLQKEMFKAFYVDWFTGLERPTLECVRAVYKRPGLILAL